MYYDDAATSSLFGLIAGLGIAIVFLALAIGIFSIIVMWKVFEKAGKTGWYSIIPIYNYVVLLEIVGLKWYYIFGFCLSFIPVVGSILVILYNIVISIKLAKSFGKEVGFGIGIAFLPVIFEAIIAFDKSISYNGPVVDGDLDFNNLF